MNARKKCKVLKAELERLQTSHLAISSALDTLAADRLSVSDEIYRLRRDVDNARSAAATWHMIADARAQKMQSLVNADTPASATAPRKNIFKRIFCR